MTRKVWVFARDKNGEVQAYEKGEEPASEMAANNVLAGDRHYDGLRASDGADISTRTKHREYMKRNGLTTMDDFKNTWAEAAKARYEYRTTGKGGAVSREDIARAVSQHLDR